MKSTIITIIVVAALTAGALFGLEHLLVNDPAPQLITEESLGDINRFTGDVTNTSILCGTTSTLLLATSTGRLYSGIVNDGSNTIYLSLSQGPAILYEGLRLNSGGGSYEINLDNLYTGPIYCIADTAAASTTLIYK